MRTTHKRKDVETAGVRTPRPVSSRPFVTVIVPIRNEERHIIECVESIISQSYPRDRYEVILVDGMSEDRTREIINGYTGKYPFIRLLDNEEKKVPSALNIGIRAARGDVIIRMDAHTYYDRHYMEKCVETLDKVEASNVGGPIETLAGDGTAKARAIALATSHPFGVGNSNFRTSTDARFVDTVPFGAFRKSVFDEVGLFNEHLVRNQDIELNSRIRRSGGKIYLNPEIKSYYYNRSTLSALWRQNFKNGMWNIFTSVISQKSLALRHFVPFIFVASLIVTLFLSLMHPAGLALFALVAGSYACANLYFSLRISLKNGLKALPFLPLVFATLHFSYGLGSIYGLVRSGSWKKAAGV